jgi:hypothetical protein
MSKHGTTKNCHYVAQSITKPWEHKLPHRNRQLRYFDFSTSKISFAPSVSLLSKYELLTPKEDHLFNILIEKPLDRFKNKHFNSPYIENYEIFRSLFLYFMFQSERFSLNAGIKNSGLSIKDLLHLDVEILNTFTEKIRENNTICAMNTIDGQLLFHSNVGYFTFPVKCTFNQSFVWALAVPLFPNLALTMIPNGPSKNDMNEARQSLMLFSVGLNSNYKKIIIPNEYSDFPDDLIFEQLKIFRKEALELEKNCNQINFLIRSMYSLAGVKYPNHPSND